MMPPVSEPPGAAAGSDSSGVARACFNTTEVNPSGGPMVAETRVPRGSVHPRPSGGNQGPTWSNASWVYWAILVFAPRKTRLNCQCDHVDTRHQERSGGQGRHKGRLSRFIETFWPSTSAATMVSSHPEDDAVVITSKCHRHVVGHHPWRSLQGLHGM